ncbi:MAG: 4-(cytidine 5'-diphospho)-2-C-methyl-D-erythritol kinase [Spirochaetes bacterium]|nr:4-(cytidine 5'-diphospho)-2-C-methyl-D-erythritol kinase [Spirochaetota bacterium]
MTAHCFAKVNLFLNVAARRVDGFHEIRSVFQTIALFDTVTVSESVRFSLEVKNEAPGITTEELAQGNLLEKVARHFSETRGLPPLAVTLTKRIPAGAGLGGGSADAAGFIRLIDRQFRLGMSLEAMRDLGARFGSDVPFFIEGGAAKVTGRGERVQSLGGSLPLELVLIWPDVAVSTALAYRECVVPSPHGGFDGFVDQASAMAAGRRDLDAKALFREGPVNDFQDRVASRFPQVSRALQDLKERAPVSMMSGSGSTVFGIFPTKEEADRAFGELKVRWRWCYRASGSPFGSTLED